MDEQAFQEWLVMSESDVLEYSIYLIQQELYRREDNQDALENDN